LTGLQHETKKEDSIPRKDEETLQEVKPEGEKEEESESDSISDSESESESEGEGATEGENKTLTKEEKKALKKVLPTPSLFLLLLFETISFSRHTKPR